LATTNDNFAAELSAHVLKPERPLSALTYRYSSDQPTRRIPPLATFAALFAYLAGERQLKIDAQGWGAEQPHGRA
jgi:hypothetical protein